MGFASDTSCFQLSSISIHSVPFSVTCTSDSLHIPHRELIHKEFYFHKIPQLNILSSYLSHKLQILIANWFLDVSIYVSQEPKLIMIKTELSALWQPRGVGDWREVPEGKVGRRYKRKGIYVYLWLICVHVWQTPIQYYKAITFQLKINKLKKTHIQSLS